MPCRPYPVSPPDGRAEGREEKSLSCLQVPLWVGGGRAARCSHSRGGAPRRRGRPCRHFEEGREGYSNPLPRRTKSDKKLCPLLHCARVTLLLFSFHNSMQYNRKSFFYLPISILTSPSVHVVKISSSSSDTKAGRTCV